MSSPGPLLSSPARRGLGLLALAALAGCSEARPDADRLELATLPQWTEVPKSSPYQFVTAFAQYCMGRPSGMAATDTMLRKAGYVPRHPATARRPALYLVDDWRPAVVADDRLCGVRAVSRTGQTDRLNRFIGESFPASRPLPPARFGVDVEQAWSTDTGMIATMRNDWVGNRSTYTVVLYEPAP